MTITGQRVGYLRVSTLIQNTDRQLADIAVDAIFTDRVSAKDSDRPALQEMLRYVRRGDTVLVHSLDRLARNLLDLRSLIEDMTSRGVSVTFVKEGMTFAGDGQADAMQMLLLNVMGSFAEFERALIRERQREGIAVAKAKGVYKGRKASLNAAQVAELRQRAQVGEPKATLARAFGVSRETVYHYLRTA